MKADTRKSDRVASARVTNAFNAVVALRGWRRWVAAFAAGVGAALAMAPLYFLPLMAVGYCVLALMVDGARADARPAKSGFAAGWFFGFGYFLAGLYWVGFSFLVEAEQFAWMAPFAVAGLPAFLALFTGTATAAVARLKAGGWRRIAVLAVLIMLAEYARGHVLTGLPWNLPGQAFAGTAAGAQTAAWWGVYGLSLIALLAAMAPVAFIGTPRGFVTGTLASAAVVVILFAIGFARLAFHPPADHADVYVRIVQPNIPQREKIDSALWRRNYQRQIALSDAPAPDGQLYVLWPENAVPIIDEETAALDATGAALSDETVLIVGAVRRLTPEAGPTLYYNSISVIADTPSGFRPVAHYDKHHLVPFGEYLPFEEVLRSVGLAQLAPYEDGFESGEGPATIRVGGTAFAPLVCYEAIFPGRLYPADRRPDWIATVTNDAWFGDSSGPLQHLDQARLRTIESGLPMARSANTGVSALFDGAGRLKAAVPLYEKGVIDAALPRPLPPTIYARFGDLIFWLMMVGLAATAISRARTSG